MKKNEQKDKKGRAGILSRNKGLVYGALTAGVAVFVAAIVLIVLAATGVFGKKKPNIELSADRVDSGSSTTDTGSPDPDDKHDQDVNTGVPTAYINPLDRMTVMHGHGFFYNTTLDCYYDHVGIDVSADVGNEVYSIATGTVERITEADQYNAAQIVINHGDGVKSTYTYVNPTEGLKVGGVVTQGQVIAKIATPVGNEYKDGAHLHLEMSVNGANADPADYLTLSEK